MSTNLILYELPFHISKYGTWVYDANCNFIFEFDRLIPREKRELITLIINGETNSSDNYNFVYNEKDGIILNDNTPFIHIRGWGSLTGNSHNLSATDAINIQNKLAIFLIDILTTSVCHNNF